MKNILGMTLKFWGSGMTAILVMMVSIMPLALVDQENRVHVVVGYLLLGFVVAPILGGASQHWFWKDHDWYGGSK